MPSRVLELDILPQLFAVARFDADTDIPAWAESSPFVSITRTPGELSVLCHEAVLPASIDAHRGLRCLAVRGPLDFSDIGILASLTQTLAAIDVSVFVVSTYDTDYLLVASARLDAAARALTDSGHVVHGCETDEPDSLEAREPK